MPPAFYLTVAIVLQLWGLVMFGVGILYLHVPSRDREVKPWSIIVLSIVELFLGAVIIYPYH